MRRNRFMGQISLSIGLSLYAVAAHGAESYQAFIGLPPMLVDAKGRPFATTFGTNTAFIRAPDGQLLYLQVNANGFATNGDMVVFPTTDCSGQPYIMQSAFGTAPFTSVSFVPQAGQPLGLNGDLYYAKGKGVTLTVNSTFFGGYCGAFQQAGVPLVPANKIALRGFVTPLSVK